MKAKKVFKTVFTFIACSALFFFISVFYLGFEMKKESEVKNNTESEQYYWTPTNSGLLFKFEDRENCLIYLNFEQKNAVAIFTEEENPIRIDKYTVDYTVNADYVLIAGIIDRIGGIELSVNGEVSRYTGVQITDLFSQSVNDYALKRDVLYEIFDRISKNGFSKEDFVYIIKNGGTDLLVPDCFYWEEYMPELAKDFEVIK